MINTRRAGEWGGRRESNLPPLRVMVEQVASMVVCLGSSRSKSKMARAIDELLEGGGALGFAKKLNLLRAIGLIRKSVYTKLVELNRIRNKCSHNWELNAVIRKKAKKRVPKRRLLEYRSRNLFDIAVLKDFASEYGSMYYKLFMKVYA